MLRSRRVMKNCNTPRRNMKSVKASQRASLPAQPLKSEEDQKVDGRGIEHRVAHDAGLRGSDHDAVQNERNRGGDRDGDDPADVAAGQFDDPPGIRRVGGDEEPHQIAPPDDVDAHEQHRDQRTPTRQRFRQRRSALPSRAPMKRPVRASAASAKPSFI